MPPMPLHRDSETTLSIVEYWMKAQFSMTIASSWCNNHDLIKSSQNLTDSLVKGHATRLVWKLQTRWD